MSDVGLVQLAEKAHLAVADWIAGSTVACK